MLPVRRKPKGPGPAHAGEIHTCGSSPLSSARAEMPDFWGPFVWFVRLFGMSRQCRPQYPRRMLSSMLLSSPAAAGRRALHQPVDVPTVPRLVSRSEQLEAPQPANRRPPELELFGLAAPFWLRTAFLRCRTGGPTALEVTSEVVSGSS